MPTHDDKIHRDRRYRPQLSQSARPATFEVTTRDEHGNAGTAAIAGEHPLTVYVDKREILTLMTLGAAPEALVIGYLRNQRLVDSIEDLVAVQVDWEVNAASVYTRNGLVNLEEKMAHRTKTTGCGSGTVFGDLMADIDTIHLPAAAEGTQLRQSTLYALSELVRKHETIYKQAGAVHGCALFSATLQGTFHGGAAWMLGFGVGTLPAIIASAFGIRALANLSKGVLLRSAVGLLIAAIGFSTVYVDWPKVLCLT